MCIFGNSDSSSDTTEDKPFEYSRWFVRSYNQGEHHDGTFRPFASLFADEPQPQAQKAANFNEDMGITDPNDPYAMLEANTKKPEEDELADDKATKTDCFKRRQQKDDNAKTGNTQAAFMNFYR